jgi:predicted transcriptional regulator of viral defense system
VLKIAFWRNKMQYIDLRESLKDFTVFSLSDIKVVDRSFHRRRLNEWQEKGYIKKIIKGYYIFSDIDLDESVLFEIANRIYPPSYISLEMALSHYHLIPESVYGITSVSTRRTYRFKTPIAEFSYRTIKPSFFFGYKLAGYNHKVFKMAGIEKAILDYLYLNPDLRTDEDFQSLRIDKDMFFEQVSEERLNEFLKLFAQNTLTKRIHTLWRFLKNA